MNEDGTGWPKIFFPKNIGKNCIVGFPYPVHRVSTPILLAGALFVFLCFHYAIDWYWCLPGVVGFILLACSVTKTNVLDIDSKTVKIFYRFCMKWTLKTESVPLTEFKAIIYTWHEHEDELPRKRVGLELSSGRRFWLRSFSCQDCYGPQSKASRGAEEFAWRLSCDTGIPINEKLVKTIF